MIIKKDLGVILTPGEGNGLTSQIGLAREDLSSIFDDQGRNNQIFLLAQFFSTIKLRD